MCHGKRGAFVSAKSFLIESLGEMNLARKHLEYSLRMIQELPLSLGDATPAQLESADAFTSRFARLVDILCNRVLRALDIYEMQEIGTLLDVALRAEKRGVISSADWLRQLKDVRNRIAHDYAGENAEVILAFCREQSHALLQACDASRRYAEARMNTL